MSDGNRLGRLYAPLPKNAIKASDGKVYEHRVEPREESRVLLEVDVSPSNGVSIAGQFVKQGVHRVVVYESEVGSVESMVATDREKADWAAAESAYQAGVESFVKSTVGAPTDPRNVGRPEEYRRAREVAVTRYGDTNVALEYLRRAPDLNKNGRPPLNSCKTVELLSAPETDSNRETRRLEGLIGRLVDQLGKAVAGKEKRA